MLFINYHSERVRFLVFLGVGYADYVVLGLIMLLHRGILLKSKTSQFDKKHVCLEVSLSSR
jgi:hypothetical protein